MTDGERRWAVWYVQSMVRWPHAAEDRCYVYRGIACVDDFPHSPEEWRHQLITAADAGDARAWEELFALAAALRDRDEPLPCELADFMADVALERRRLRRRPGMQVTSGRDAAVILGVRHLQRSPLQLKATRQKHDPKRRSACDVVAEAFGLSYGNTERIWRARDR